MQRQDETGDIALGVAYANIRSRWELSSAVARTRGEDDGMNRQITEMRLYGREEGTI
jgi:hypothetical protein